MEGDKHPFWADCIEESWKEEGAAKTESHFLHSDYGDRMHSELPMLSSLGVGNGHRRQNATYSAKMVSNNRRGAILSMLANDQNHVTHVWGSRVKEPETKILT